MISLILSFITFSRHEKSSIIEKNTDWIQFTSSQISKLWTVTIEFPAPFWFASFILLYEKLQIAVLRNCKAS